MNNDNTSDAVRQAVPGPGGPAAGTPERRPGSVRRTTTHDSARPGGPKGDVTLTAIGRDLHTGHDGTATVLAAVRVAAVAGRPPGYTLSAISADPADPRLAALCGTGASSGFRRRAGEALGGERESGSVYYQLIDDMPTALLVSGYATLAALQASEVTARLAVAVTPAGQRPPRPAGTALQQADMCSGWVSGGVMVAGLERGIAPYFAGPPAPVMLSGDPLAWHALPAAAPGLMRRHRRIDVWPGPQGYQVESFFRDSYFRADGTETIVHEYTVTAQAVARDGEVVLSHCEAGFGSLPWPECPGALASAGRVAGLPVSGLRAQVRDGFYGVGTCTHLNDTLRALQDVGALVAALEQREPHPEDAGGPSLDDGQPAGPVA